MVVVAIAGGTGDMGQLIVDALLSTGKHEVYVLSRKDEKMSERKSPISGESYQPLIQTDYASEAALVEILSSRKVNVVMCTFTLHYQTASDAQVRLIQAADAVPSVTRFIPSEFNIDYDQGDDVLPYQDKKFHRDARRALERTTKLEYTYIYPGMFMDYFGIPHVETIVRELFFFVDPAHRKAILPADGEAKMPLCFTADVGKYTALALDLERWPRVLTCVASTVTLNELVALAEKALDQKIDVAYQSIAALREHKNTLLPSNATIPENFPQRFPNGVEQLRALIADFEASIALGAYDFTKLSDKEDLVEKFKDSFEPRRIEEFMHAAWNGR